MSAPNFLAALLKEVLSDCYRVSELRRDTLRFPEPWRSGWSRLRERASNAVIRGAANRHFIRGRAEEGEVYGDRLEELVRAAPEYALAYTLLADETSRDLLVKLLAYRVLGGKRVPLPTNARYWKGVDEVGALPKTADGPVDPSSGWQLHRFDLESAGFPIRLVAHQLNVLNTFLLEQYRFARNGEIIEVEAGDVVLDAGGGWGDTALYAALRSGEGGQVFCFEFTPNNVKTLRSNLALNPELKDRIVLVEEAVWDRSGETLNFQPEGPGTRVSETSSGGLAVRTRAIDDLVRERGIEHVDFIKMDVEGAELKALRGAEMTIRTHRPKLAISVYHKAEDIHSIPRFLAGLGVGYTFYLDHFTTHGEETVLFARSAN